MDLAEICVPDDKDITYLRGHSFNNYQQKCINFSFHPFLHHKYLFYIFRYMKKILSHLNYIMQDEVGMKCYSSIKNENLLSKTTECKEPVVLVPSHRIVLYFK
jgi:hypothetical protein